MIYFDNSATTLHKPPQVSKAVAQAIHTLGNPGRSFYPAALEASRTILDARQQVAALTQAASPLHVAFTSGATESLNLVIGGLITSQDQVITTPLEHNSVLRPLYRTGCDLRMIPCNSRGELQMDQLPMLLTKDTRYVVCTHGSNLTGALTDVAALSAFCRQEGLVLILDVSQTLGCTQTLAQMADVLCFTGHKGLFGPQGTGGVVTSLQQIAITKTGGAGSDSFSPIQPAAMPDLLEAGTPNTHGLAGLAQGCAFVNQVGVPAIAHHGNMLLHTFLDGLATIPGLQVYGPTAEAERLPIVALGIGAMPSEQLASQLWEGWSIATRAGSHCAPLLHRHFGTCEQGMVRFSFSYYNTLSQVQIALDALAQIAARQRGGGSA